MKSLKGNGKKAAGKSSLLQTNFDERNSMISNISENSPFNLGNSKYPTF